MPNPDCCAEVSPNLILAAPARATSNFVGDLAPRAAEYGNVDAAKLLLDRGADVNARATIDQFGIGGQTPIFHAVTQFGDWACLWRRCS